jgi:hypothetical protein
MTPKTPPIDEDERYAHDVEGMPVFPATAPISLFIGAESMAKSIPNDPQNCAIAQGCRAQLRTPYVHIARTRTDIAFPHPMGIRKPGFGTTLWAIVRWQNTDDALGVVIAADTPGGFGALSDGAFLRLNPPTGSELPSARRERDAAFRKSKATGKRRERVNQVDALTRLGVRNLSGQRQAR